MDDGVRVVDGEIMREIGLPKATKGDGIEDMIDLSIAYSPVMYMEPGLGVILKEPVVATKRNDDQYTVFYSFTDLRGHTQRRFRNVSAWELTIMRAEYMRRRAYYYEHYPMFNYAEKEWIVQHFFNGHFFDPRNGKREVIGSIINEYQPPR